MGRIVKFAFEAIDGLKQALSEMKGHGECSGLLHGPWGVAGCELDHAVEKNSRYTAIANVDGFIDDRVQALRSQSAHCILCLLRAGNAVDELAVLGVVRLEAAYV